MMIIYGTMRCKDCVLCREDLDLAGILYEFRDFDKDLKYLKEFLKIRDENPLFQEVRKNGNIGIPCILLPDGHVTLDWHEVI